VSYTCAQASKQLIMKVACPDTMNKCVSLLAGCLCYDHRELIGWQHGCFSPNPWLERGSWGEQWCFDKELNRKHHCCCSTHRPPIEWGFKVVNAQCMCNIPSRAKLHTTYSSRWVAGDIISYAIYDLQSHARVQRWASIQYPSMWIRAYKK